MRDEIAETAGAPLVKMPHERKKREERRGEIRQGDE